MAKAAEEVGFESVWLGDHLLYDGPERAPWEAWTLLSALAAATSTVRLGPLVACAGFHPPAVLAKMASTIDEVSGGRFVLGIGVGLEPARVRRLRHPVRQAGVALRGGVRDHQRPAARRAGDARRHVPPADDVVLLPKPARQTPIMIGSNGKRMLGHRPPPRAGVEHLVGRLPQRARGPREADRGDRHSADTVTRSACMLVQLDGQPVERRPEGMDAVEQSRFAAHIARTRRGRRRRGDRRRQPDHRALDPNARRAAAALGDGLGDLLFLGAARPGRASRRRPASAPGARA